jgi:hypothetical protein
MTNEQDDIPPAMPRDPDYTMPARSDERQGPYFLADVTLHEDHLKTGSVGGFSVRCDEGARLGGTDTAPSPLSYFTIAVGF